MFDPTITLGNAISVAGFIAGSILCVAAVRRDVAILATRLTPLEGAVAKMLELLQAVSRQDERLKAVERDVERNDPRKQRR